MPLIPLALAAALGLAGAAAPADGGCRRQPLDPEFPAGLAGRFEIVGRAADTGLAYAGERSIALGQDAYALRRRIGDAFVEGEAWIERCGHDGPPVLVVHDRTVPATRARCSLGAAGDNALRATCLTRRDGSPAQGLESWFQVP